MISTKRKYFAARALLLPTLSLTSAFAQPVPLVQDAFVNSGSSANYGAAQFLAVNSANQSSALVQFDLATLAGGVTSANIAKATLVLFVRSGGGTGSVNFILASSGWSESTVNGSPAPGSGPAFASGVALPASNSYLHVDVTMAVQSWFSGTTNNGIIVTPNGARP